MPPPPNALCTHITALLVSLPGQLHLRRIGQRGVLGLALMMTLLVVNLQQEQSKQSRGGGLKPGEAVNLKKNINSRPLSSVCLRQILSTADWRLSRISRKGATSWHSQTRDTDDRFNWLRYGWKCECWVSKDKRTLKWDKTIYWRRKCGSLIIRVYHSNNVTSGKKKRLIFQRDTYSMVWLSSLLVML